MAEPFVTYLTVFKSRLATANLSLAATSFGHQPDEALLRKVRQAVERRESRALQDPANATIFDYLIDKRIVSSESRAKGRYRGYKLFRYPTGRWNASHGRDSEPLDEFPVYAVDAWMANPRLESTIGAPTPDNAQEIVELAFQLRLLSRAKNTWTSSGHLVRQLRDVSCEHLSDPDNPFLLGLEATALLRQVVEVDGPLMRELVREVLTMGHTVTRDAVAQRFVHIVERAVVGLRDMKLSPPDSKKVHDFLALIQKTDSKRASASRAPGVLEHRVSPRLEWLTDLGYLSKAGLPKNGFEYKVEGSAKSLLTALDTASSREGSSDSLAISEWRSHQRWQDLRPVVATANGDERFRTAYRLLRRRVGPSPIRDVAFFSGLISREDVSFDDTVAELTEFARSTTGASLSGGRRSRTPENIFIPDSVLEAG